MQFMNMYEEFREDRVNVTLAPQLEINFSLETRIVQIRKILEQTVAQLMRKNLF